MKKQFSKIKARQVTYLIFLLSALAIFSISCEKEDSVSPAVTESSEQSIVEVLKSFGPADKEEGAELKMGRRAPAPGDKSVAQIAIDNENFKINEIKLNPSKTFNYFPGFLNKIFNRYLDNIYSEIKIKAKVIK